MNRLLFADYLRRNRSNLIAGVAFVAGIWFVAGMGVFSASAAIAWSLLLTAIFGPLLAFSGLAPREVRLLPMSRREIWRTSWWLSTVVAVGLTTTGKVLGLLAARVFTADPAIAVGTVWLSSTCDFAYAGAFLGLLSIGRFRTGSHRSRLLRASQRGIGALVVVAFAGSVVWPFLFREHMPTRWNGISALTGAIILAGLGLTIRAYFTSPAPIAAPDVRAANRRQRVPTRSRVPEFSDVTGLRRIALRTWISAVVGQTGLLLLVAGVAAIIGVSSGEPIVDGIRGFGLLPFEADFFPFRLVMVYALGAVGLVWSLTLPGDSIQHMLRHLRTLPLGTAKLNAVLIGMPVVSWINAWVMLAALHLVVVGRPLDSFRLLEFFALIGIQCIARALTLRWRKPIWSIVLSFPLIVIGAVIVRWAPHAFPAVLPAIGVTGIVAAALLNHRMLTRSRLAYTPGKTTGLTADFKPV